MGFQLDVSISALTVFLQGMISFFSPCVLPLLPLYIGYLSGGTGKRGEDGRMYYDRKKVMVHTLCFVLGVSFTFFVLGLGVSALGQFFKGGQALFARVGGIFIVLIGLYQLGIFGTSDVLSQERRLPVSLNVFTMSPVTAFVLGFTFSFAWTPCVGPAMTSVLLMAASASTRTTGFLLIGVYTLGFVLPFLAVGFFTTAVLDFFKRHGNIVAYTVKAGAVLMIFMGVMMAAGVMNDVTGYLSDISVPFGQEQITESTAAEEGAESPGENDENIPGAGGETVTTEVIEEATENKDEAGEKMVGEPADNPASSDETEADPDAVPAIDFTLYDQYGNEHTLSEYKGKTVFLNFWATWCPPCRNEMPEIQKLY